MNKNLCPCGSNNLYVDCCYPFIQFQTKKEPKNALALMRSRYVAYALNFIDYIIKTTHPKSDLYDLDHTKWREEIKFFSENTSFKSLEIVEFIDGEEEAFVTFIADLEQNKVEATFTEKSRFKKLEGRWFYYSGKTAPGRIRDLNFFK